MIRKNSWPIFMGLLILSFATTPNVVNAQKGETGKSDEVAERLAAAREISASSGKPIMAIVSNLDTT